MLKTCIISVFQSFNQSHLLQMKDSFTSSSSSRHHFNTEETNFTKSQHSSSDMLSFGSSYCQNLEFYRECQTTNLQLDQEDSGTAFEDTTLAMTSNEDVNLHPIFDDKIDDDCQLSLTTNQKRTSNHQNNSEICKNNSQNKHNILLKPITAEERSKSSNFFSVEKDYSQFDIKNNDIV